MALTASLNLVVPALSDTEVWFLNAAAWSNYWQNIDMTATFDGVTTSIYTSVPYVPAGHVAPTLNIDGQDFVLCSKTMFDDLLTQVQTLDTAFQQMRSELKAGGMITEAQ